MIRPIVLYPDPRLKMKSKPVSLFDEKLAVLASDMVETMRDAFGVGLAAIQVGEPLRMMVMDEHYDQEDKGTALVLCNPEILKTEGSETLEEGCLSLPDVREDVERAFKVQVKGRDVKGKELTLEFEGMLARCVLHEIDHMNGQLFIQKVPAVKRIFLQKKLGELKKNYETAVRL
jgi:peptide deformylase